MKPIDIDDIVSYYSTHNVPRYEPPQKWDRLAVMHGLEDVRERMIEMFKAGSLSKLSEAFLIIERIIEETKGVTKRHE